MPQHTNTQSSKAGSLIFRFDEENADATSARIRKKRGSNMKTVCRAVSFLFCFSFFLTALNAIAEELLEPMRTWTSRSGKTIEGVWLPEKDSSDGKSIAILKKNGKEGRVKVSVLSSSDAEYVRRRQAQRRRQENDRPNEIILDTGALQDLSSPSKPSSSYGPVQSYEPDPNPQYPGSSDTLMFPSIEIIKYDDFSLQNERKYLELIREFGRTGKKELLKTHSSQKVNECRYLFSTAMYYKNLYDALDIKNPSEDALRMVICDRIEAFRMRFSQFSDCAVETRWLSHFETSILIFNEFLQKLDEAVTVRDQKLSMCRTIGEREQLNAAYEEFMNGLTEDATQKLTPLNEEMLALEEQLVRKYGYVDYSAAASSAVLNVDAAVRNEDLNMLYNFCDKVFKDAVLGDWEKQNKSKILSHSSSKEADLEKNIAYLCYLASLLPEHSMYDLDRGVILKGITDSLVVYRVFESENFDLEFAIQCTKFTLAYFADNTGECRFGLAALLQAEGEFDMAIELSKELIDLYKGDYFYALRLASLCVEKKFYEEAFLWFEAAISAGSLCEYVQTMQAGQPVHHVDFALIRPDVFCELQRQDPDRFANILRPSLSWDHQLGNEYDLFQVVNHSPFPVHNVKFKVTFSDGEQTWTRTYYADRIEAGDALLGNTADGNHCTVRYPTSTSAEITCDENSKNL